MGYVEFLNGADNPNEYNGHCVGTAEIQGYTQHGSDTDASTNKHCSVLIFKRKLCVMAIKCIKTHPKGIVYDG